MLSSIQLLCMLYIACWIFGLRGKKAAQKVDQIIGQLYTCDESGDCSRIIIN